MILNPWDVQSKHIHTTDGIASSMYAADCRWGGSELYVLIEGNNNDIPKDNRSADGKQPSGELLRTGCLHRHVHNGEGE